MTALVTELADAVADLLNNGSGGALLPVQAVRRLFPIANLKHLQQLNVMVAPREELTEPFDRSHDSVEITIDVGVRQICTPENYGLQDELTALCDRIKRALSRVDFSLNSVSAEAKFASIRTQFDPEAMHTDSLFVGVISATYTVIVEA